MPSGTGSMLLLLLLSSRVASLVVGEAEPISSASPPLMVRHIFNDDLVSERGTRCLDGSASGYYLRRNTSSSDWVFYLQGGGLCIEAIDCIQRTRSGLGSSKHWSATHEDSSNVLSTDATYNPFSTWNHVYLPYCSGDTWAGARVDKSEWLGGLYTAGHITLEATLDALTNSSGFSEARRVLLTGGSAGGIGVFQNADWFSGAVLARSTVVQQGGAPPVVKASPQAGYYFPRGVYEYPMYAVGLRKPFDLFAAHVVHDIEHSFLDETCVRAVGESNRGLCWDAFILAPYISTPLFVAENKYDENQLHSILLCPGKTCTPTASGTGGAFMVDYGAKMVASLRNLTQQQPGWGFFVPSCLDHTGNLCMKTSMNVQGFTYAQALANWFDDGSAVPRVLIDNCTSAAHPGMPCNLQCGGC